MYLALSTSPNTESKLIFSSCDSSDIVRELVETLQERFFYIHFSHLDQIKKNTNNRNPMSK